MHGENTPEKMGIARRAVADVFDRMPADGQVQVGVFQIYNETINDLLGNPKVKMQAREDTKTGHFYVDGLEQCRVSSSKEVFRYLDMAMKNRTTTGHDMNEQSSRGHLIFQINVITAETQSKLSIIDLAGSERVKDSGVSGEQLNEATYINQSLFHLIRLVQDVKEGRKTSVRNSKLTMLIADSIGGNCQTIMLGMVSPSQQFCRESYNTLMFATNCSLIQNFIKPNKYEGQIDNKLVIKKVVEEKVTIPWTRSRFANNTIEFDNSPDLESLAGASFPMTTTHVPSALGKIAVHVFGPDTWDKKVVCMYQYDASAFIHQVPAFLFAEHQVYLIDPPGYGFSSGKAISQRCDTLKSGPGYIDVVKAVMKHFALRKPVYCGFDLGASTGLRMCVDNWQVFSKLIAFHGNFIEAQKGEIARLKT